MVDPLEWTRRAESDHFWFRGFRWLLQPVLESASGGRRNLSILDCGCGTGRNASLLSRYGRVVGVELSAVGVEMARRNPMHVVRGDITLAPFRSDAFDLATAFDVLQFVADEVGVREMARVVRPGGILVLTLSALDVLRGDHSELWQERRRYTPATARRLVEQAGLRVERVSFLFGSLFPLMLTARFVQRRLRSYRGARPDNDISVPSAPFNAMLTALLWVEAAVTRMIPAPVGSSVLVVARKPGES